MGRKRKWFTAVLIVILLLVFSIYIAFRSSYIQTIIVQKITSSLNEKMEEKIFLGGVDFELFTNLVLEDILVLDSRKDSLISIDKLKVNFDAFSLFSSKYWINTFYIDGADFYIYKGSEDLENNFSQFVNNFLKEPIDTNDHQSIELKLENLLLNNVNIIYEDNQSFLKQSLDKGQVYIELLDVENQAFIFNKIQLNKPITCFRSLSDTNQNESILVPNILLSKGSIRINRLNIEDGRVEHNEKLLRFNTELDKISLTSDSLRLKSLTAGINIGLENEYRLYDWELNYDGRYFFINGDLNLGGSSLKFYDRFDFINGKDFIRSEHLGKMHGQLDPKDFTFINQNFSELNEQLSIYASYKGNWQDFELSTLEVKSREGSEIYLNANSAGKTLSLEDAYFKLYLDSVLLVQKDLSKYSKQFNLPLDSQSLDYIQIKGEMNGFISELAAYTRLNSNLGDIDCNVFIKKTDLGHGFKGNLNLIDFNIGSLAEQVDFGLCKSAIGFNGDLNKEVLSLDFELNGDYFNYKEERIERFGATGSFEDEKFRGTFKINDDAVNLKFDGNVQLLESSLYCDFILDLRKLNLKRFGLLEDDVDLSTHAFFDFKASSIEDVQGSINLNNVQLIGERQEHFVEEIEFVSDMRNGHRHILLNSPILDYQADGDFLWYEMPIIFGQYLQKRYPLFFKKIDLIPKSKDWLVDAKVKNINPVFEALNSPIRINSGLHLQSYWNSYEDSLSLDLKIPGIAYKETKIKDVYLSLNIESDKLDFSTSLNHIDFNKQYGLDDFKIKINQVGHQMDYDLSIDAQDSVNYFAINGQTQWKEDRGLVDIYDLDLEMGGEKWEWRGGDINFDLESIYVQPQILKLNNQNISIAGKISSNRKDVFKIMLGHISLNELFTSLDGHENLIRGKLSGVLSLRALLGEVEAKWGGKIDELYVENYYYGDFDIDIINEGHQDDIEINILGDPKRTNFSLNGHLMTDGNIHLSAGLLDFDCKRIESLAQPHLKSVDGMLNVNIELDGNIDKPIINGRVNTDSLKCFVDYLGVNLNFKDTLKFTESNFNLNNFDVYDQLGNLAYVDGLVKHDYFTNWSFDSLSLQPQGPFYALNTTYDDNQLFYGKGLLQKDIKGLNETSGLLINGPIDQPHIDLKISANDSSNLVIPIVEEEELAMQSLIRFKTNELQEKINKEEDKPLKLSFNGDLELQEKAELEILLGVPDGDIIKVRGGGNLQVDYNDKGDFLLFGQYKVDEGNYIFNFQNLIKKKFDILEGSQLAWTGDPYAGQIDLRTSYRLRTNIAPLLREASFQGNENIVRSTVYVIMEMKGDLMSPSIKFNIRVDDPQYASIVDPVIKRIQADDQELNKQVFTLLLIKRFAPLFNKTTTTARSNVLYNNLSEYVSGQLQEMLSSSGSEFLSTMDLGVELDSYEDVGLEGAEVTEKQRELKLALSKKLFNDRVIIDVGTKLYFADEQENQFAGDFSIEYLITKDGRVRVKLFNESQNQQIVQERNIQKRGVSLSYKREYDTLKELFSKWN